MALCLIWACHRISLTRWRADQKKIVEQRAADNGLLTGADEKAAEAVDALLRHMPGVEDYTLEVG